MTDRGLWRALGRQARMLPKETAPLQPKELEARLQALLSPLAGVA